MLRERLEAGGIDRRNKLYRDVPHTLMFIQAGETIRRIVLPTHVHYGDAAAYYAKVPLATRAVRTVWIEYLDGKITRETAIDRIIETVLAETRKP